jgi:ADP-heptose:LPS heptosyltransferase
MKSVHQRKLILRCFLSPGDIIMLTAAVRDLHMTYPGRFLTDVRTPCPELWEYNPYITLLSEDECDVRIIDCECPLIHQSNTVPYHFIHGFRLFLSDQIGLPIVPTVFKGDIHLTTEEKGWLSQVDEIAGEANTRFWIIVSGGKTDYTAKWWDPQRCQQVVDQFKNRIVFVQCGADHGGHVHPKLRNVIDLVGKTNLRQMVRLMYHAEGVICPVTMYMHLASAVESKPGQPQNRPCVVIAGGREPPQWEAYPHHCFLHTNGALPCCDNGGCWKSRTVLLGDDDDKDGSLCLYPTRVRKNLMLPKCMDMITAVDVIRAVERYSEFYSLDNSVEH